MHIKNYSKYFQMKTQSKSTGKTKTKSNKRLSKIGFDSETVPKDKAKKFQSQSFNVTSINPKVNKEVPDFVFKKITGEIGSIPQVKEKAKIPENKPKKKKKTKSTDIDASAGLNTSTGQKQEGVKKKRKQPLSEDKVAKKILSNDANPTAKKKKKDKTVHSELIAKVEESNVDELKKDIKAASESIRAAKRKRHAQLLEEKKLKSSVKMQEKCLNYLSQWKYNRNEWKFEKLRQVWLINHMFDLDRLPDQFFDTLVDYLSKSEGKSREIVIKQALKVIEHYESLPPQMHEDESYKVKYQRARTVIQFLQ